MCGIRRNERRSLSQVSQHAHVVLERAWIDQVERFRLALSLGGRHAIGAPRASEYSVVSDKQAATEVR